MPQSNFIIFHGYYFLMVLIRVQFAVSKLMIRYWGFFTFAASVSFSQISIQMLYLYFQWHALHTSPFFYFKGYTLKKKEELCFLKSGRSVLQNRILKHFPHCHSLFSSHKQSISVKQMFSFSRTFSFVHKLQQLHFAKLLGHFLIIFTYRIENLFPSN